MRLSTFVVALLSFYLAWYLAGSDDEARSVIAPLLAIGALGASIWGVIVAFDLGPSPTGSAWVLALPLVLGLVAWPFSGITAIGRPHLGEYLAGIGWRGISPLLALVYLLVRG